MDTAAPRIAPETVSATLRMILRGLMAALGGFGLDAMRGVILYRRIGLVAGRIERMLARFRAGRLWRVVERERAQGRCGRLAGRGPALPRRFGWLVQAGGHRAAGFGAQLRAVLAAPEMVELLAASPQAARLLRPLCRALAVELPGCVAQPRQPATAGSERTTVRRRTRAASEDFRIPLPRGALSAARREGFGKDRGAWRGEAS